MSQLNLNTNYTNIDNGQNRIIVNGPAEIFNSGSFEIIKFTGDGTFQITRAAKNIEYLVVGGGGPGGALNPYASGGAGGGGGQLVSGAFNSVANYEYQVKVGAGGTSTPVNIELFNATGGLENTYTLGGQTYKSHTFISGSGSFVVGIGYTRAQVLVVGGGGGGATGGNLGVGGEGGGGGAVLYSGSYDLQVQAFGNTGSYTVTVGAGGATDLNGIPSTFKPNFSYATGYTTLAYGGGRGSGSGASGGGDGLALYGTSSLTGGQGQDGGQRLLYSGSGLGATTMSYYQAPGGGGMTQAGTRYNVRVGNAFRVRIGSSTPFAPNIYNISWEDSTGVRSNLNTYNVPNCNNLGATFVSGTVINLNTATTFSDLIFGFSSGGNRTIGFYDGVYQTQVFVDYEDQYGNWNQYATAVATNAIDDLYVSSSCGDHTLAQKIFLENADGSGNGGNGAGWGLVNGTASYYGGGGGGGVYEGFNGYWVNSTSSFFTGSYGGLGGGGNGAGALLSLTSGSATGSLIGSTGSANTGGGGGGGFASATVGNRTAGGAGGSGIVVITYPLGGSENQFNATGSNGGDSSIAGFNLTASAFTFTALGGGAGGGYLYSGFNPTPLTGINGQNGGSGGGAGIGPSIDGLSVVTGSKGLTLAAFGNDGAAATAAGTGSGGGGGAGAAGSSSNGGAGKLTFISGSGAYMGAGGGAYGNPGGLGFGNYGSGGSGNGGQGASGVVIVKFDTSVASNLY